MKKSEPSPTHFTGDIDPVLQARIDSCNSILTSPDRLQAIVDTGLLDNPNNAALDRLAKLLAQILKAPLTLVSLVSDEKQMFKGAFGLPPGMELSREIPIDGSICRYTLHGEAIIANDASTDPLLKYHPATGPWGIGAFIAIPMVTPKGMVLGAFCAVHPEPHVWTELEIMIMQELTASVMTEIYLRQQVAELEIERELRERFVMTLTHDLRSPLTSSKLSAQMISMGNQDIAKIKKSASKIALNIDRADRLIQDILDSNKIKSGQELPLHISHFDLTALCTLIPADFSSQYGARFKLTAPPSTGVNLDYDSVWRMLENLLHNAVKYGSEDRTIDLSYSVNGSELEIKVHNFGNAIDDSDLETIFEPYKRTSEAKKSGKRGWGLGLALVRSIAKSHHGKVSAKSSVIDGTTFSITLPVVR